MVGAIRRSPSTVLRPHNRQTPLSRANTKARVTDESNGRPRILHRSLCPWAMRPFLPFLLLLLLDAPRHSFEHSLSFPFRKSFPHWTHGHGSADLLSRSTAFLILETTALKFFMNLASSLFAFARRRDRTAEALQQCGLQYRPFDLPPCFQRSNS
jgi:hypothetical protein